MPTLQECRDTAKQALEALIADCQRELSCLESYTDTRMKIATGEIRHSMRLVDDAAFELDEAFDDSQRQTGFSEGRQFERASMLLDQVKYGDPHA